MGPHAHLLDGHDGLVLGTLGGLVQHGAEAQPVEGHLELLLVQALTVQAHGLLQVLHGGLQAVLVLLDARHLHVHLAPKQDQEAGERARHHGARGTLAARGRLGGALCSGPPHPAGATCLALRTRIERRSLPTSGGPSPAGNNSRDLAPRTGQQPLSKPGSCQQELPRVRAM